MSDDDRYDYSRLVDEAIEALPTVAEPILGRSDGKVVICPVLEDEAEGKLLILALIDQLGLDCGDAVARLLGIAPLSHKSQVNR